MAALFWKVQFPLHARSVKYQRMVHALCIVIGVVMPLVPVIVTILDDVIRQNNSDMPIPGTLGFGFGILPPLLCSGLNSTVTFYAVILPNVILIFFGTSILVLTIRSIHKVMHLL